MMHKTTLLLFGLFALTNAQLKICAKASDAEKCSPLHAASKDFHCVTAESSIDCLFKLQSGEADFGIFGAEEALLAAELSQQLSHEFNVIGDIRNKEHTTDPYAFQTVVVVRSAHNGGISGLAGKSYCHPGFSRNKYWTDPVLKALENEVMKEKYACPDNKTVLESEIKGIHDFFGPSCRPGAWTTNNYIDKKLKQKYGKLCKLCDNEVTCSYKSETVGTHFDALNCLYLNGADVAYTSLAAAKEFFKKPVNFQFLCKDGTTNYLNATNPCTWVKQPWPLIVTAPTVANTVSGKLKDTIAAGGELAKRLENLLAGGDTNKVQLLTTPTLPTISSFISQARDVPQSNANDCKRSIKWCTTSKIERTKCQFLATAARTHGIKPYIECPISADSSTECLRNIQNSLADVAVISTNHGFAARDSFNLTTVAYVEGEPMGYYYHGLIAVLKESNAKSLADLKGKRACFPSYNGLGWLNFVKSGINSNQFSRSSCSSSYDVTSFFSKSCAPGAKDSSPSSYNGLCSACSNSGNCNYAESDGELGALKCLLSGSGDVAFIDYNVISRYNEINSTDVRILCKNGILSELSSINLENCANTQVISHEVVTRNNKLSLRDIQNVMELINDWFANKRSALNLFGSFQNQTSVLFPKEGIDLINAFVAQGPYTNDYKDLLVQLQHCNNSTSLQSSVLFILLAILTILFK